MLPPQLVGPSKTIVSSSNPDWSNNMAETLKLQINIHSLFVTKVKVEEGDNYYEQETQFENDVKQFYEFGKTTFLASKADVIGNMETFYIHTLQYNLVELARVFVHIATRL